MATKTEDQDEQETTEASADETSSSALSKADAEPEASAEKSDDEGGVAAAQLGEKRFVYAAYFGGAIAVAFLMDKLIAGLWAKLSTFRPEVGEPREDIVMALAGAIGVGAALYYWRRTRARQLAEEVAQELSKVTWPSKQEVTSSTTVVIVTTAVATVFFALMDRFWGFVTNFVYGI